jgi:cytochrome c oxidase accessory protein FixG
MGRSEHRDVGPGGEAPSEAPKTIGRGGRRVWLYPEWFRGRWLTLRTRVHLVLMAVLLAGPWFDIGAHPAVRIDIVGRRIHFWGLHLFATDGAYFLFMFGFVVFAVFLFTALFGRVWCGWACPQTVFLESLVRPIERWIEGSAQQRRKLDAAPWSLGKLARKAAKYAAYLAIAGAIGTTFTAYFLGRDGTLQAQLDPLSHPAGTFTFVFITALLMFDFAWFREQVCLVVCPYGRFQSALLDRHSLTVVYDDRRGEPRGKKGTPGAGDCVDCGRCVAVCPTGTDIRKGVTMECVQCMACLDVCDDVMGKLHRAPRLIRVGSEHARDGGKQRFLRTRVAVYGLGLLAVLGAFAFSVARRSDVELAISRQPGVPYVVRPDGAVQNALQLRVANKSEHARAFVIQAQAPDDLQVITAVSPSVVPAGAVVHVPLFLVLPGDTARKRKVSLRVTDGGEFSDDIEAQFVAPGVP